MLEKGKNAPYRFDKQLHDLHSEGIFAVIWETLSFVAAHFNHQWSSLKIELIKIHARIIVSESDTQTDLEIYNLKHHKIFTLLIP